MKWIKRIVYPICAVVIAVAGWKLWQMYQAMTQTQELYTSLWEKAETLQENTAEADDSNPWLTELQKENPELVGWIRIDGTNINYPVMQTAEDNDYYLDHDFERESNAHGTPFLDVNCRIGESENLIIYGHNMKDGTMFRDLMLYKDAEFCASNGTIEFLTPEDSTEYQVRFVLLLSAEDTEVFPYYEYVDLTGKEDDAAEAGSAEEDSAGAGRYEEYLQKCAEYAIWQSEELPETGAELLTLSTCEYSTADGRLVVVAERHLDQTE